MPEDICTNKSVEEDSILGNLKTAFTLHDLEGPCITDVEYHDLKGKVKTVKRDDLTITYDSLGFITSSVSKTESKFYKNYKRVKNLVLCDVFNEKDSLLYRKINVYKHNGDLSYIANVKGSTITRESFEINRESEYYKLKTYNDSVIYRNVVYKKSSENNIVKFHETKTVVPNCTKYVHETSANCCDYLMIDQKGQLIEVYGWCDGYISPVVERSLYDSVGNMIFREERSDYYGSKSWEYTYY